MMQRQQKRELTTAVIFLIGAIFIQIGYLYPLYKMDSRMATLFWVNPRVILNYVLYAAVFFVLPYEKFNDLLKKERNANKDKGLLYALFSNSKLRTVTLLVLAGVVMLVMEQFVYSRMFITFSTALWRLKYVVAILGVVSISLWTVWEIKEQYKSFVVAHIGFLLLGMLAYLCSYDEFIFAALLVFGGSLAWNISYAIYNKKLSLVNIMLTVICLVSMVCTCAVLTGRVTQLENIFYPERDPFDGGWELLQIRKYWSGTEFKFESAFLEQDFLRRHPLLMLFKHGRGMCLLVFVGLVLVLGASIYYIFLHKGKKRYVVVAMMSYVLVLVGAVVVSGLGIIPCNTVSIPFSGILRARDAVILGVVLRCMVPYSLVKWKRR